MKFRRRLASGGAAPARPRRAVAIAPRRANSAARRAPFAVLIVGLIVGGMVMLLALNTASAANEVDRSTLADQDQSVAAKLVQLQNQAAASAAPQNLARAAAALGMVPAGVPAFLIVGKDGTVRLLGHAVRATGEPVAQAVVAGPAPADVPMTTETPTETPTSTATPTASATSTAAATATVTSTVTSTVTASATPSDNATTAGARAHHRARSAARHHARRAAARQAAANTPATATSAPPSPSPTPTPVVSLPGGTR